MASRIDSRDDEGLVNTADAAQVAAAADVDKDRQAQARHDVRAVMSTREGRRAVRRWLGLHGLYRSVTAVESSALTYALSGRRDAGLEMLEDLVATDGDLFLLMEYEHRQDEARRAAEAAARAATTQGDDLEFAA
jgi:hypothetical protein